MRGKSRGSGKRVERLGWMTRTVTAAIGRKRGWYDSSDHGIEQGGKLGKVEPPELEGIVAAPAVEPWLPGLSCGLEARLGYAVGPT
ncbi:hypothetical protein CRG98_010640 [Punica granatum]|uniref:Uncharacterized protein n=1 Tax=Punica granatum TaxID=22663 RepID=A0A2I0KKW6_PUNGR|nr:hypothetical protein CRG98_010640 [Punica granatum]